MGKVGTNRVRCVSGAARDPASVHRGLGALPAHPKGLPSVASPSIDAHVGSEAVVRGGTTMNSQGVRHLRLLLVLAFAITHCSALPGGGRSAAWPLAGVTGPALGAVTAADLHVTDVRSIELPDRHLIGPSPDGRTLAADSPLGDGLPRDICLYETATLAERACADLSDLGADLRLASAVWSPESKWLAFGEWPVRTREDSDLWVLNAASGELRNLTDDGFQGPIPAVDLGREPRSEAVYLDVAPGWSPDGKQIAFARTTVSNGVWRGTEIRTVELESGAERRIAVVTEAGPGVVPFGLRWTADGAELLYAALRRNRDDPDIGIWIVDANGGRPRLLAAPDTERRRLLVADVAATGRTALVYYLDHLADPSKVSYFGLLDLMTGSHEPLTLLDPGAPSSSYTLPAAFSPDGLKLIYASHGTHPDNQLIVRDIGGTEEYRLAELPNGATTTAFGRGMSWGSNDTVFVPTAPSAGVLVRVEDVPTDERAQSTST